MPPRMARAPATFSDELRRAIRGSGLTSYRIGKDGGIGPEIVDRFVDGKKDPRLSTVEKLLKGMKKRLVIVDAD